jgi:hypothetical protein
MKNSTNRIKLYGIMVLVLFAMILSSTSIKAQSDEGDKRESSFSNSGSNSSRFESDYNNDYSDQRPTYESSPRRSVSTESDYNNDNSQNGNSQNYKELDIEIHRESSNGEGVNVDRNTISAGVEGIDNSRSITNNVIGNISSKGNPKINPGDLSAPDNPDDPDVPIDGGVVFLIAAGLGYGIKKMKSNKRK